MLLVRIKFILDMYKWGVTSTDSALEQILDLADKYKFGFGKIRLERYLKHYQEAIESLNEGYLNLKDVERVMLEEVKIGFYGEDGKEE